MNFILDTSIYIEMERENKRILEKIIEISAKQKSFLFISSPTYSEVYYGILKRSSDKEIKLHNLNETPLVGTTKNSARICAELKLELERKGKPIPIFDLIIASIAIDRDMTLITTDEHFKKISKLKKIIVSED
ncbi:type II toxin-antitoxin system VapC family toxin [Candidatus Woesearchaeota archaeon]|nr:type II toxin-antitoxin system VapC family toxin [Candidatus Woesearchaeota archaeon]